MNEPPTSEADVTRRDGEPQKQHVGAFPDDWWDRVKAHKVLQWGLAYLGAALAFAHGGDLLGHAFHWPEALNRLLLGVLIVGFPVALALAWYHGHRSLKTVSTAEATIISILLVIGAGLLVVFVRPSAEEVAAMSSRTTAVTATTPMHPVSLTADGGPSIAVLPFVNMSSDREQEYFSDGLSEELLNELTRVPGLRVIGRTSSFAFKGKNEDLRTIGETLGVDNILEGSVRKSGETLRITAQLINPADGSHVWSEIYDRKLGDVFEIQEEIARTVAASLRVSIEVTNLREGGTHNLEAYDEYLRSRADASPADAVAHLERAVALDPRFTRAWADLAGAAGGALVFAPARSGEWLKERREAINQVLALAPNSGAAKELQADSAFNAGRLLEAEQLLQSAQGMSSGLASGTALRAGTFLLSVGRSHDSLEVLRAAQQADPIFVLPQVMVMINLETLGDMKEADATYRRAIVVLPNNELVQSTVFLRALALHDQAVLRAVILNAQPAPQPMAAPDYPADAGQINAAMVALLDNPPAALALLHRWGTDPNTPPRAFLLVVEANWAAYFGDAELSLNLLRGIPLHDTNARSSVMFSLWRPIEKPIRRLPQFKNFVRELGLLDYWRASGKWGDFCHPLGQSEFECN
jgi:TolB-like protein/tetratricopeptide (TPR) repeat protein